MSDVHEYRKAIADDCVVGVCSMNNCLYPDCSPSGRQRIKREPVTLHTIDGKSVVVRE